MARTFFHTAIDQATPAHTASEEKSMLATFPGGSTDVAIGGIGTAGELILVFSTAVSEPDNITWPNGTYRALLDVPSMDSTLQYGLVTLGNGSGHFARLNTSLGGDVETHQQVETPFSTPGLKSATYTGPWADGLQTDRFECLIAAQKVAGHGNDTMTFRMDSDGLCDGPWPGLTSGPTGIFFDDSEATQLETGTSEITSLESGTSDIV